MLAWIAYLSYKNLRVVRCLTLLSCFSTSYRIKVVALWPTSLDSSLLPRNDECYSKNWATSSKSTQFVQLVVTQCCKYSLNSVVTLFVYPLIWRWLAVKASILSPIKLKYVIQNQLVKRSSLLLTISFKIQKIFNHILIEQLHCNSRCATMRLGRDLPLLMTICTCFSFVIHKMKSNEISGKDLCGFENICSRLIGLLFYLG